MPTILLIDDDDNVRQFTAAVLEAEGYETVSVASGMEAFELLSSTQPDLVLLDVVMPGVSGLEVLDLIRRQEEPPPVILLSSLRAEENVVRGLRLGADDYVVKPFSARELVARIETQLRRGGSNTGGEVIEHGELRIDSAAREVSIGGRPVETTAKEFDLLQFFATRPGRVFTRRQLLVEVWNSSGEWQQAGTVTEHVRRLRAKVEADLSRPARIVTVRGVGYRYERRAASRSTVSPLDDASTGSGPLDASMVEELIDLESVTGRPLITTMATSFLDSADADVAELGEALAHGDHAQAARVAHRLAGSSGTVGALSMAESCAELHEAASRGDGAASANVLERVIAQLEQARPALEALMASLRGETVDLR